MKVFIDETLNLNVKNIQAHDNGINRIKHSSYNNIGYVATCSNDNLVKIWDSSSNWTLIQKYTGHNQIVHDVEFIKEDQMASGGNDATVQLWYISTGLTQKIIQTGSGVFSLQILSTKTSMACGLANGKINIYNINDGSLVTSMSPHNDYVFDLLLINNDYLLASSSRDNTISIWDLITNTNKFILKGHTDYVTGLKQVSFDIIASSSLDTTIKLWNITSGQLIRNLVGHTNYIYWSLDLLSDGQTLVSGSWDQTVKFWNWKTGQLLNSVNTGSTINALNIINATSTPMSKLI
jgi:WD40 repeat protein